MKANDYQVGGEHYRAKFQHWDFVAVYGLGYFEGNITKYVARHPKKNKEQDIEKAMQYTRKLIELFQAGLYAPTHVTFMPGKSDRYDGMSPSAYFARENGCGNDETMIINKLCRWDSLLDLIRVESLLRNIRTRYGWDVKETRRDPQMDGMLPTPDDGSHPQAQGYVNQDGPEGVPHHPV